MKIGGEGEPRQNKIYQKHVATINLISEVRKTSLWMSDFAMWQSDCAVPSGDCKYQHPVTTEMGFIARKKKIEIENNNEAPSRQGPLAQNCPK